MLGQEKDFQILCVRTYVIHVRNICDPLGRSKMCLMLQETRFQVQMFKSYKSVQESSEKVQVFKAR